MDDIADVQNGRSETRGYSNEKYSEARIIEALLVSRGMIATAARLLGCSRQTIYDAIERHPDINTVVSGERELLLDTAECKLHEAIDRGEPWAVKFYLLTQGQKRGYIERQRLDIEDRTIRVLIQRDGRPSTVIETQPAIEHRETPKDLNAL